ncbi:hypothetical protein NDU88_002909 [Pleurodeles waltl]|uniref:Uncharacterized protein n=1 Tax=Pleurodeles waltl TaxID=8319 RepID=A0AAV7SBX2_PLEWA|nr:hypothetical protein NDU88_002909 [Pleurodeles waltl]
MAGPPWRVVAPSGARRSRGILQAWGRRRWLPVGSARARQGRAGPAGHVKRRGSGWSRRDASRIGKWRGTRLHRGAGAARGGEAVREWHGVTAEAAAHAPDLEQLIQEQREAIQLAAAISASPAALESETEISQPPSDQPVMPDRLSELGFQECPSVTPATADKLF